MWFVVVFSILVSMGSYISFSAQTTQAAAEERRTTSLAVDMATYRQTVIEYFTDHPDQFNTVPIGTLRKVTGFPSWSSLADRNTRPIWVNYRSADGTIFIYAASPPSSDISAEIIRLSNNSLLAGVFRTGDTTLYSPVFGNTGIPLPRHEEAPIPNGSPVWIAMRN